MASMFICWVKGGARWCSRGKSVAFRSLQQKMRRNQAEVKAVSARLWLLLSARLWASRSSNILTRSREWKIGWILRPSLDLLPTNLLPSCFGPPLSNWSLCCVLSYFSNGVCHRTQICTTRVSSHRCPFQILSLLCLMPASVLKQWAIIVQLIWCDSGLLTLGRWPPSAIFLFLSSHGLPSFQEAHNDILIRMGVDLASGKWKRYIFDLDLTWSTSASICSSFWSASRCKESKL